jgi:hypothetical protein
MTSHASTNPLTPAALVNSLTPRAIINVFHRYATAGVLASFPKTGTTWLSAMLRHLIVDAYNLPAAKMPKLFISDHRPSEIWRIPFGIPLIYHSHFITTAKGAQPHLGNMLEIMAPFRDTPMVVLFRDAKDVLVSYYMEVVFREPEARFSGTVDEFAHSDTFGVKKFVAYYNALAGFRRTGGPTLITRYETLWANTLETLRQNALFLGIRGLTDKNLKHAVEQCSMENMRRIEMASTPENVVVPDLFRPAREHNDAFRTRVGGSGNWRKHLSPEVAGWVDDYVNRHLDPFFLESRMDMPTSRDRTV